MSNSHQPDEDLRGLLRSADPAASLTPLDPDRITRMVNHTTSQPAASPHRSPRRPLLIGLAGATGLAAAAFAVVTALTPATMAATRLVMPAGDGGLAAGSCQVVAAGSLAPAPLAFEATATAVTDDLVTLDVTEVFRGEPADTVEVVPPEPSAGDFSAFEFIVGVRYLIAVSDSGGLPRPSGGEIALCGLSGPASPDLRAVYEEAFR